MIILKFNTKKFLKIIGNISFAILLAIMGCVVFISIQSKITGKNPSIAGYQIYTVLGGSMEPVIHRGSVVILRAFNPENLAVSDIITFKDGSNTVTHRIAEISNGENLSFITRGDANNANDFNPVPAENVIGKAGVSIPYIGYVLNFTKSKTGLLSLIIIPGLLIIIYESFILTRQFVSYRKQRQQIIWAQMEERLTKASDERSNAALQ